MKLTGTNKPTTFTTPKTDVCVHCAVPERRAPHHPPNPPGHHACTPGGAWGWVCRTTRQRYGGHSEGETPGPIPNPEAKPLSADGTARETVWESRTPPDNHSHKGHPHQGVALVRIPGNAVALMRATAGRTTAASSRTGMWPRTTGRRPRIGKHEPLALPNEEGRACSGGRSSGIRGACCTKRRARRRGPRMTSSTGTPLRPAQRRRDPRW